MSTDKLHACSSRAVVFKLCVSMQVYTESTDGSYLDVKESALVRHYKDADPDFGRWQAKVCCSSATHLVFVTHASHVCLLKHKHTFVASASTTRRRCIVNTGFALMVDSLLCLAFSRV